MSNLAKTLFFNLAYKNAPMKSNWWTPLSCLDASASKYFKFLLEAVGYQVSPTISLFRRSPLTTMINFNLSGNNLPELVIPYMDFNNLMAIPKYFAYSGKYYVYLISNLTKTLFFTFACKNAPMKYNLWTLALCLAASAKKYFKVLMEAVGDQVSPTISLFCRSPLTTILNFNLSSFSSDWILALYTSMHVVTGSP